MSNTISYIIIYTIVMVWLFLFLKKKSYAMTFLIYTSIIYYAYSSKVNIDIVIKVLFLITILFSGYRYGFKKYALKILLGLTVLFVFGTLLANFTEKYTLNDNVTAFISTSMGFLIAVINWSSEDKEKIMKSVSFIPIISIIVGIILIPFNIVPFFSRAGKVGLGGASMATNLAFFCVVAIMASIITNEMTNNGKYRFLAYVNFGILLLTLTRGGILAGFIIIFPDLVKWLKKSATSLSKFLITIIIVVMAFLPMMYIAELLMNRSFLNGEFNSSGRFEAWKYMLGIVNNKWVGNGYGYLKTATDQALRRGFNAAHNEYIRVYLEAGYVGIVIHIILFIVSFKAVYKEQIIVPKKYVIFFVLAFLIYSISDNTITNYRFWIPYMFILCLLKEGKVRSEKNKVITEKY